MLRIDYKACAYESFNPAIKGGNFTYAYEAPDVRVAAPVSEALNKELAFQFRECLPLYVAFVENPFGFLYYHSSLFDKQSGEYALYTMAGAKGIVWHFLKPNGQVFSALLGVQESERKTRKWQYVVEPPDARNIEASESRPYRPKVVSFELFQSFYKFIKLHGKRYDSLFKDAAKKYKDIVSLPPQRTPSCEKAELLFFAPDKRK